MVLRLKKVKIWKPLSWEYLQSNFPFHWNTIAWMKKCNKIQFCYVSKTFYQGSGCLIWLIQLQWTHYVKFWCGAWANVRYFLTIPNFCLILLICQNILTKAVAFPIGFQSPKYPPWSHLECLIFHGSGVDSYHRGTETGVLP